MLELNQKKVQKIQKTHDSRKRRDFPKGEVGTEMEYSTEENTDDNIALGSLSLGCFKMDVWMRLLHLWMMNGH